MVARTTRRTASRGWHLVGAAVLAVALSGGCGASSAPQTQPSTRPPSSPSPTTTGSPATPASPSPTASPFAYQMLWPFADAKAAASWQQSYRQGGHQPWHLSADATALSFTSGYLGIRDVDRVTARRVGARDARVSVGYTTEGSRTGTAAVVHLVRIGTGTDAPWEVVGTDDTTLTVTRPAYGAVVSSPVTVGGTITGVDESIRLAAHALSSSSAVGQACCLPAGGERTPWTMRLSFTARSGDTVTIVATTGGHLQAVERFAVTGVRVR